MGLLSSEPAVSSSHAQMLPSSGCWRSHCTGSVRALSFYHIQCVFAMLYSTTDTSVDAACTAEHKRRRLDCARAEKDQKPCDAARQGMHHMQQRHQQCSVFDRNQATESNGTQGQASDAGRRRSPVQMPCSPQPRVVDCHMNTLSSTSVRPMELRTRSRFLCLLAAIRRPFALTSTPHSIIEANTCTRHVAR